MATKRSVSSFQNQPSKKKIYYDNHFSVEDVYSTADTQDISEWFVQEVNPNKQSEDLESLVIDEDEDAGIENFTISEQKKTKMFTNQNKEFVKLIKIKKNKDSSETFLILKQNAQRKLARLLPQLQTHYESALQGKKVNVRCKLSDNIYVSCNDQYPCVDFRVFFVPRGDTTSALRPTRRGISFYFNETKRLLEIIENIVTKLNINTLDDNLECEVYRYELY